MEVTEGDVIMWPHEVAMAVHDCFLRPCRRRRVELAKAAKRGSLGGGGMATLGISFGSLRGGVVTLGRCFFGVALL